MNKTIYLDNAATTPLEPRVVEAMLDVMRNEFGNPSSIHAFGRKTKGMIELARKQISSFINAKPSEIIFTSGGTEADNLALHAAVVDLGVKHIVTSALEHHAVGHTVEQLAKQHKITFSLVNILPNGHIDLNHLSQILSQNSNCLVSLMHANNEIGNLLALNEVGQLCEQHGAYFHTDTVQTIGHIPIDVQASKIHFLTCGAHKFHGPKGVGFLYKSEKIKIHALIQGGSQERNLRGGTENLYGIVGMAKAMEIACNEMEEHKQHILGLKQYMAQSLSKNISDIQFNGDIGEKSLYTILNVSFPPNNANEMLLFNLDINGIAASGGSACTSGSDKGSHVLNALNVPDNRANVRFSFSKYTTKNDIDYTLEKLNTIFNTEKQ